MGNLNLSQQKYPILLVTIIYKLEVEAKLYIDRGQNLVGDIQLLRTKNNSKLISPSSHQESERLEDYKPNKEVTLTISAGKENFLPTKGLNAARAEAL